MKNKVKSKTIEIINNYANKKNTIDENSSILNVGIDSIGFIMLVVDLEDQFGIEIDIQNLLSNGYTDIYIKDLIKEINYELEKENKNE